MGISKGIRAVMELAGLKHKDITEEFGYTKQIMSNKMAHDRWTANELAHIAKMVSGQLMIKLPDGQVVAFEYDPALDRKKKDRTQETEKAPED